ncbi:MAG: chemotaxis protein CheC [Planctomycetes bacterium]|nr:chemotaxis protein CheC [Planctomycetota bacterium]
MNGDELRLDALRELINIGVGRAASTLSTMTGEPVRLSVPEVFDVPLSEVHRNLGDAIRPVADVRQTFQGALVGSADLLFPSESAAALVNAVTGDVGDDMDLDDLRVATLEEIGNIVLNCVMGTIGNLLDQEVLYAIPAFREAPFEALFADAGADAQDSCILVRARFTIVSIEVHGDLLLIFDSSSRAHLWTALDRLVHGGTPRRHSA